MLALRRTVGSPTTQPHTTVDTREIKKFSGQQNGIPLTICAELSDRWWDLHGPLRTLHHMNPTRIHYIKHFLNQKRVPADPIRPLEGIKLLDIGCGAGVLSEPLARLGADVTGIDASISNIKAAEHHANKDPMLQGKLKYMATTAEELASKGFRYDAVCAMEIVEHVSNVEQFVRAAVDLVKPGGTLFMSTVNRTTHSYALAILAAEYVLGLLDRGTHDWNKFVKPEELRSLLKDAGMVTDNISGVFYNPLTQKTSLIRDTSVNYILCATKPH